MTKTETQDVAAATLARLSAQANPEGVEAYTDRLASESLLLRELAAVSGPQRIAAGYGHTLREILQQPFLWADTAVRAAELVDAQLRPLHKAGAFRSVAITGSGSSHYVAELAAPALQSLLGLPVASIPAGDILTRGRRALPLHGPVLLVSIARSGNSPESLAAVRVVRAEAPDSLFLNITCNAQGKLATEDAEDPRTLRMALHPLSNDESLVMTSSFTCLSLGVLSLCGLVDANRFQAASARLAERAHHALPEWMNAAAALPYAECRRAVFLGDGCQFGAAREAALKLTEMTAGHIVSMPETFLGLRHGPMAAIHADTLVHCFLPPGERALRYAGDLVAELERKQLGRMILRLAAHHTGPAGPMDEAAAAIRNVVFGQLAGFFACRSLGLRPDAPSEGNVITRVVEAFPLYH